MPKAANRSQMFEARHDESTGKQPLQGCQKQTQQNDMTSRRCVVVFQYRKDKDSLGLFNMSSNQFNTRAVWVCLLFFAGVAKDRGALRTRRSNVFAAFSSGIRRRISGLVLRMSFRFTFRFTSVSLQQSQGDDSTVMPFERSACCLTL